jgi:hypothetical protein
MSHVHPLVARSPPDDAGEVVVVIAYVVNLLLSCK